MKKLLRDILITAALQYATVVTIILFSLNEGDNLPAKFFIGLGGMAFFTALVVESFHSAIKNDRG